MLERKILCWSWGCRKCSQTVEIVFNCDSEVGRIVQLWFEAFILAKPGFARAWTEWGLCDALLPQQLLASRQETTNIPVTNTPGRLQQLRLPSSTCSRSDDAPYLFLLIRRLFLGDSESENFSSNNPALLCCTSPFLKQYFSQTLLHQQGVNLLQGNYGVFTRS